MSDQLHFKGFDKREDCFGGSLFGRGHPKQSRPLDSTKPMHLVLRATASVLRKNDLALRIVSLEIQRWSKRCGVTVYRWANVGNHLHLAVRVGRVHQWSKFIRSLTGSIARKFQAAGLISSQAGLTRDSITATTPATPTTRARFWQSRPFTRIVRSWRRAFKTLLDYIRMNQLESLGILCAKDRVFYRELHRQWRQPDDDWPSVG